MLDLKLSEALRAQQQGKLFDAWQLYQILAPACQYQPHYWLGLSLLCWQMGNLEQADHCLNCAQNTISAPIRFETQIEPDFYPDFMRFLQALDYSRYPQLWLSWPQGLHLLAQSLMQQGQLSQASGYWTYLSQLEPGFYESKLHLGHLALHQGQIEQAIDLYLQVLHVKLDLAELHYHLGRLYLSLLQQEKSQFHFEQARQDAQHPLFGVQAAVAYLPLMPFADYPVLKTQLLQAAQSLYQQIPLSDCLDDLARSGMEPFFDINYFDTQDHLLRAAFADIFVVPAVKTASYARYHSLKQLAVFVSPGHEALFDFGSRGLIQGLKQMGLETVILALPPSVRWFQNYWPEAKLVALPADLKQAVHDIQSLDLELLYYWESGTDAINYFLPFFQLARQQFTSWGSVSTTANPHMQYFLSAQNLETPDSLTTYREQLIQLPVLPMFYRAEQLLCSNKSRTELALPEGFLFACPHNPQKLNDSFLKALQNILAACPTSRVVMLKSRYAIWQDFFEQRIQSYLGDQATQVIWQDRLAAADFAALLMACDLILDPFEFGSGKLAFEALGLGQVILTCPGERLRGRIVAACYHQMNLPDLIATSESDYVQQAIALAHDPLRLSEQRQQILASRHLIMQHPDVMDSLYLALQKMSQILA